MTNKIYERAFNVAIKCGFCSDCRWKLDGSYCHECDCYQNAVKVIRDALEKLDDIEESKATVWHNAQNDPPKEIGITLLACDNSTSDAQCCLEFDSVPKISDFGDENDLIRRGDALKAIRKACISAYLPFDSATPEGQRVMAALYAVWKVKKEGKTHDSI